MPTERLDRIERAILHHPDPVVSAPELASVDELEDLARRQVLDELRLLERAGDVGSKKVGGNAVAWYHRERVNPAPPRDPADHPDQRGLAETAAQRAHNAREGDVERSGLHEECNDDPVDGADRDRDLDRDQERGELVDEIDADLERALGSWDPGRTRQERRERRRIGVAVLRWLRDRNDGKPPEVTRADAVAELFDELALEGQSEDTWWRKCARPALNHAAESGLVDASGRTYEWIGETEGSEP